MLGWREVPVDASMIGPTAQGVMPSFRHLFVDDPDGATGIELDRKLFVVRKRCEHEITNGVPGVAVYFPSLSSRTLVYKGMLTTPQLGRVLPDLGDERVESALALVHSRFSTNTFPSWPLAHPYRFIAHNGEINTVQGNRNWMRAREALMATPHIPGSSARSRSPRRARPTPRASTSASSCCISAAARSPRGADDDPRGVGEPRHHGARQARVLPLPRVADGAVGRPRVDRVHRRHRDRCGARPQRSAPEPLLGHRRRPRDHGQRGGRGRRRSRARSCARAGSNPAGCSSSTPPQGRIVDDDELKAELAAEHPYGEWLGAGSCTSTTCPSASTWSTATSRCCGARRRSATRTRSSSCSSRRWPRPAPRRSVRWAPTRRSRCSRTARLLFDYFQQLFAQVTNPPLDAIREELVTSLSSTIGAEGNLLAPGTGVVSPDRAAVPDHRQRRARQAHPHRPRRRPARVRRARDLRLVPGGRGRCRAEARRSTACAEASQRRSPRASGSSCSPIATPTRVGADPVAPAHVGGAPPHPREDPHEGRPRRRDRRRPRGAPHGAARWATAPARSTRTSRSSRIEDLIAQGSTGSATSTPTERSRTTSRPRARACSR